MTRNDWILAIFGLVWALVCIFLIIFNLVNPELANHIFR